MPREREHQTNRVGVVVAAGKADDVNIFLARRDGVGDVLRTFDGVNDEHEIANALAPIRTQVARPTIRSRRREEALIRIRDFS